jgi:hypothetical protein
MSRVAAIATSRILCLRRTLALPLYALALVLDVASTALGRLAARTAGDRCGWIHEDCCVLAPPPE